MRPPCAPSSTGRTANDAIGSRPLRWPAASGSPLPTREVFKRLVKVAAEHGWGEYRTHTAFMDDCAEVYSFNDHALRRFCETLKDAVDPNGIIAAGRGGIWPRHIRERRA